MRSPRNIGVIDPTNLTDFNNEVLTHFLLEAYSTNHKKIFLKNTPYEVKINNRVIQFKLSHTIFHRKRASDPNAERFEIIANNGLLGEGSMGKIFKIAGTLAPNGFGKFDFKNKIARIVKIQELRKNPKEKIISEFTIAKKLRHILGIKEPVFTAINPLTDTDSIASLVNSITRAGNQNYGLTVMHQIKGENLETILDNDRDKDQSSELTTDQRIDLTIKMLEALQKQVHDNGIIHVDIKPANVMVDSENSDVTFIDYSESWEAAGPNNGVGGTRLYVSPEQVIEGSLISQKTDLYTTGKTLAELWKIDILHTGSDAASILEDAKHPVYFDFEEFDKNDLDPEHKNLIKHVIAEMTQVDPDDRPAIDECLTHLHKIKLQRKLTKLKLQLGDRCTNEYENALNEAFVAANETRIAYRKIFQEINQSNAQESIPAHIKNVINAKLINLKPDDVVITQFVDTLGIKELHQSKSKEEILEKIDGIYNTLADQTNHLLMMSEALESLEALLQKIPTKKTNLILNIITPLNRELARIIDKHKQFKTDIDETAILNKKYAQAIDKFKSEPALNIALSLVMENAEEILNGPGTNINKTLTNAIKHAIYTYFHNTFNEGNLKKVNVNRLKDIVDLLTLINTNFNSESDFKKAIHSRLNKVKRGIFNTNIRFFRNIGKSNLVDLVTEAIKNYEKTHETAAAVNQVQHRRC